MRSFHKLTWVTLIAVYVLILVGGIVRSTGAGMGCPDWPKCFGTWIPPTSVDQLPANYKVYYGAYRDKKNQRFARYLEIFGFEETAKQIRDDESILEEADFNVVKTWIEYINRLVGVVIGMLIITVCYASLPVWRKRRSITMMAFGSLVLVIFQGWIGSVVVSTNLTPWTITLHMLLALALVGMLVWLVVASDDRHWIEVAGQTKILLIVCVMVLLIQIVWGTQVRESIDKLISFARDSWVSRLGRDFEVHRSFSWLVLVVHLLLAYRLVKDQVPFKWSAWLMCLTLTTILAGVGLAYLAMPAALQTIHLLLATMTFGLLMLLFFKSTKRKRIGI